MSSCSLLDSADDDASAIRSPPASPVSLHLSPLPPTPPRTSSTVSCSAPSDLFPTISRKHFAHGVTALLALRTVRCATPPSPRDKQSLYYGIHPPTISTKAYVDRLLTHAHCSPSAFVVALVYLRRVARAEHSLRLCPENMHRLVITALVIAVKMVDDRVFSMRHYARVGGVPSPEELARLERQFLVFIRSHIFVSRKTFLRTLNTVYALRENHLGSAAAARVETDAAAAAARASNPLVESSSPKGSRPTPAATASTAACTASTARTAATQLVPAGPEKGVSDTGPVHMETGYGRPGGADHGSEGGEGGSPEAETNRARNRERGGDGDDANVDNGDNGSQEEQGQGGEMGDGSENSVKRENVPERRRGATAATTGQLASGVTAAAVAAGEMSETDDLLTVQTAVAEIGQPPVFGVHRGARAIERPGADVPALVVSFLEDDSGLLDDSDEEDDIERGFDDFEIDGDEP